MTERGTVLVVEDDPVQRGLLVDVLADEGYTVLAAEDAPRALRLAREHAPGLVLADQGLPGPSGLDLLAALRAGEATHRIPLVLLSGLPPDGDGHRPDAVLAKPFDLDELLAFVARALGPVGPAAAG